MPICPALCREARRQFGTSRWSATRRCGIDHLDSPAAVDGLPE